ncbi:MAG: DUF6572 domain-containing protein, partial [Bacteroidota bacterium]
MAIDQLDKIDFISVDTVNDRVVLTISDHLSWEDEFEHSYLLQEKSPSQPMHTD